MKYSPEEITKILNGTDTQKKKILIDALVKEAGEGDARANYMIAKWHQEGMFGFKRSKAKYEIFMKKSIEKMLPDAIYDYGVSKDGNSAARSRSAFGYYILAAVLGDIDAIDAVANYFMYGIVVDKEDFVASALRIHKNHLEKS